LRGRPAHDRGTDVRRQQAALVGLIRRGQGARQGTFALY
jgi:hypothetical protein